MLKRPAYFVLAFESAAATAGVAAAVVDAGVRVTTVGDGVSFFGGGAAAVADTGTETEGREG